MFVYSHIVRVPLLLLGAVSSVSAYNTPTPFYGATASGKTAPPRGWNSFVLQSNQPGAAEASFQFNVANFDTQCGAYYGRVQTNFDYYCSIDSGWSVGGNGDDNGRFIPDSNVWNTQSIQDFAAKLHAQNMKLGLYVIPGAFSQDSQKFVEGTNIQIGSLFNYTVDGRPGITNNYNARYNFDYTKDGVQQWHDSIVKLFNSWGVDMIKLDYVTPGSDLGNPSSPKPADSSQAVAFYHNAIMNHAPNMGLDISWRLDRSLPYWNVWQNNADTLRLDRDINLGNNPVTWGPIQRTIEQYRQFINQQVLDPTRQNKPIMVRPDMDNLIVGNAPNSLSGLTTTQRYSQASLWIGAGANLLVGSDMTNLDSLGNTLLFNQEVLNVASFTSNWPMVPKNPSDAPNPGGPDPYQLQTWISGPNEEGTAVVILSNLGEDQCWDGECSYGTEWHGVHLVNITFDDLGISGNSWWVRRVLGGGGQGGPDFSDIGKADSFLASNLNHYETVMYKLQMCGTAGAGC